MYRKSKYISITHLLLQLTPIFWATFNVNARNICVISFTIFLLFSFSKTKHAHNSINFRQFFFWLKMTADGERGAVRGGHSINIVRTVLVQLWNTRIPGNCINANMSIMQRKVHIPSREKCVVCVHCKRVYSLSGHKEMLWILCIFLIWHSLHTHIVQFIEVWMTINHAQK